MELEDSMLMTERSPARTNLLAKEVRVRAEVRILAPLPVLIVCRIFERY